jgi:23S rRNA pseudouridine1911/1915/1917 synthase
MHEGQQRLDRWLRKEHPSLSWRQIRDAIEQGQVTVDGQVQREPDHVVGARADVKLDRNRPAQRRTRAAFEILHEDDHILVINKPAGVLSIPTDPGQRDVEDTVLRRAREYVTHKHGPRSYVGMLHRLDRETSGALAIALSKDAHAAGRELFKHHRFERQYLALVRGVPDQERGTIESRISSDYRSGRRRVVSQQQAGLDATTDYIVREQFGSASLVELRLHTGRQHQIRLHLQKLGHPILGEKVYEVGKLSALDKPKGLSPRGRGVGGDKPLGLSRTMLHAWTLAFPHPITGVRISVQAPLPRDFERLLARLRLSTR